MRSLNKQFVRNALVCIVSATNVAGFVISPAFAQKKTSDVDAKADAKEDRSENRDFLKRAYQMGVAEVEFGRLAREQATNADVKKFASTMVIEHQKMNEEITSLAESRRITLTGSSQSPSSGQGTYLSALTPTSAKNGYGDFENDKSNNDTGPDDGKPITLGGKKFEKGLGVHAPSTIVFPLDGKYTRFQAKVGVDDEVGDTGSVRFQVFADDSNKALYDSGSTAVEGTDDAKNVDVDVTGKKSLKLVVTDAGDGNTYDHADWADAKLVEGSSAGDAQVASAKLSDADDLKRDRLAKLKGAEFDKQYLTMQVEAHEDAVKLFQAADKNTSDAKVDQFAKKHLPALKEHHERAQALAKQLK